MTAIGQSQAEVEDSILPEAGSDFRGRCILLVEDNELNSEIAVEILKEYGFLVDTAENGAEAVEKVKNSIPGNYDLVLMDGFLSKPIVIEELISTLHENLLD